MKIKGLRCDDEEYYHPVTVIVGSAVATAAANFIVPRLLDRWFPQENEVTPDQLVDQIAQTVRETIAEVDGFDLEAKLAELVRQAVADELGSEDE